MERAEFLHEGAVPFTLAACERFKPRAVSGYYDEKEQVWLGGKDTTATLTLTLTATPGDNDQDQD